VLGVAEPGENPTSPNALAPIAATRALRDFGLFVCLLKSSKLFLSFCSDMMFFFSEFFRWRLGFLLEHWRF
jgi:hypothetical protein